MTYDEKGRAALNQARTLVEAARVVASHVSTLLRAVHERHPCFYSANQIERQLHELREQLRREAEK